MTKFISYAARGLSLNLPSTRYSYGVGIGISWGQAKGVYAYRVDDYGTTALPRAYGLAAWTLDQGRYCLGDIV